MASNPAGGQPTGPASTAPSSSSAPTSALTKEDLRRFLASIGPKYPPYTDMLWDLDMTSLGELARASKDTLHKAGVTNDLHKDNIIAAAGSGAMAAGPAPGVALAVPGPEQARKRFVQLLKKGNIDRPDKEVLDTVELRCAWRMMVCSGVTMAVKLYQDVKLFPGASTQHHLFTQLGLRVNGPLYPNPAEGPACLLVGTKASGQPAIVKMLSNTPGYEPGGTEAAAYRALYRDVPDDMPLVAAELVTLELTTEHKSTGHLPGQHAALVMPVYASTVAKLLELPSCVLLEQGKRMKVALDYMHSRHYVHMDVKGDNIFVDHAGLWWLGDFGSAVPAGQAVRTTTPWFAPLKDMFTVTAKFSMDWHMLAVALVCELHKTTSTTFKDVLIVDGHTPLHSLEAAVGRVQHEELKQFLQELVERARV